MNYSLCFTETKQFLILGSSGKHILGPLLVEETNCQESGQRARNHPLSSVLLPYVAGTGALFGCWVAGVAQIP